MSVHTGESMPNIQVSEMKINGFKRTGRNQNAAAFPLKEKTQNEIMLRGSFKGNVFI